MLESKLRVKIGLKQVLSGILTFMLVLTSVQFTGFTTFAAAESKASVSTSQDLINAIKNTRDNGVISIKDTIRIDKKVSINKNITLTGGGTLLRARSYNSTMLEISPNVSVTMDDLTIDGNFIDSFKSAIEICSGAKFTMNGGKIVNCVSIKDSNCTTAVGNNKNGMFVMNGGEISGNMVFCKDSNIISNGDNSTFVMVGGKISENKIMNTESNCSIIYNRSNAICNVSGGEISSNDVPYGNVIYNDGNLTMSGGTIHENFSQDGCVGVYNSKSGTFTMQDGTISCNINDSDNSGEAVINKGSFVMEGGKISQVDGNGVYNVKGTFTMKGGEISQNKYCGVYNYSGSNFIMENGKISQNTDGGVCNDNGATFTMKGGEISQNTNIGVLNKGTFTMADGNILENTSSNDGGGVYADTNSVFTMQGGTISKNTADNYGGGLYMNSNSSFEMSGGTITGNKAKKGSGIYFSSGDFNVKGTATIIDNGKDNNDNVMVVSSKHQIVISGEYTGMMKVNSKFGRTVVKAGKDYTISQTDKECFKADDPNAHLEYINDKLIYTENKTEWGQMAQVRKATYYIDENGKASAEITGKGEVWLNSKPDGSGNWYGIDNSQGLFESGSRFYVQVIDDLSQYYDMIGSKYREKIEGGKLRIFLIGVINPDGEGYTELNSDLTCYVKIDPSWDKNKLKAIFINGEDTENINIEYVGTINKLSKSDEYVKLTLRHFSPYAIYQAKDLEETAVGSQPTVENSVIEKSTLEDAPATGENFNYAYLSALSTMLIITAAGIIITKRRFDR